MNNVGISISVFQPIIDPVAGTYIPKGNFIAALGPLFNSYSHIIDNKVGFQSASITMSVDIVDVYQWLDQGLGYTVVVYGAEGTVIWEGFVNSLSITMSGITVNHGPLFDVANRVSLQYTPYTGDYDDDGNLETGDKTTTTIAEDTDSQKRYGIIEKILSTGDTHDDTADQIRDVYLEENKWATTTNTVSLGQSTLATLSLSCLGFGEWLKQIVYNNTLDEGSVTIDAKIKLVLAADPNDVISTDLSKIVENVGLTEQQEIDNRRAFDILQGILTEGDAFDNRWIMGVLEDQVFHYSPIPTEIEYTYRMSGNDSNLRMFGSNTVIQPWNVRPGKWAKVSDFVVGNLPERGSALHEDPRNIFIESVNYTAPFGLTLTGGKTDKFAQKMAKLGTGGI